MKCEEAQGYAMLPNILHCCLWQWDYIRCEGLYLPIAFRYSHLDISYSCLDTSYSHLDTRYSHLQLPVVVLTLSQPYLIIPVQVKMP